LINTNFLPKILMFQDEPQSRLQTVGCAIDEQDEVASLGVSLEYSMNLDELFDENLLVCEHRRSMYGGCKELEAATCLCAEKSAVKKASSHIERAIGCDLPLWSHSIPAPTTYSRLSNPSDGQIPCPALGRSPVNASDAATAEAPTTSSCRNVTNGDERDVENESQHENIQVGWRPFDSDDDPPTGLTPSESDSFATLAELANLTTPAETPPKPVTKRFRFDEDQRIPILLQGVSEGHIAVAPTDPQLHAGAMQRAVHATRSQASQNTEIQSYYQQITHRKGEQGPAHLSTVLGREPNAGFESPSLHTQLVSPQELVKRNWPHTHHLHNVQKLQQLQKLLLQHQPTHGHREPGISANAAIQCSSSDKLSGVSRECDDHHRFASFGTQHRDFANSNQDDDVEMPASNFQQPHRNKVESGVATTVVSWRKRHSYRVFPNTATSIPGPGWQSPVKMPSGPDAHGYSACVAIGAANGNGKRSLGEGAAGSAACLDSSFVRRDHGDCEPTKSPIHVGNESPKKRAVDRVCLTSTVMPSLPNAVRCTEDLSSGDPSANACRLVSVVVNPTAALASATDDRSDVPQYDELINFARCKGRGAAHRCVMCGFEGRPPWKDGSNKRMDEGIVIIPTQNKDVCKTCDTLTWKHMESGVLFKWCKGCKRFHNLAAFAGKLKASKCDASRARGRASYMRRKEPTLAPMHLRKERLGTSGFS